jgi:SAM-dependent methyltransferase
MSRLLQPSDRQFCWISSVTGNSEALSDLHQRMSWFYSQQEGRKLYQDMLDGIEKSPSLPGEKSDEQWLPQYICSLQPTSILEVGCSNGRVYRQLRSHGYLQDYAGIEVADYVIQQNQRQHPESVWKCGGSYEIPFPDNSFDICFSTYVLEHLVYPERALVEMMRVLRPGGCLILVFPDFVESGRLASPQLGFSPIANAASKLRSGKFLDALVSLYDSRVRLPSAMRLSRQQVGAFPINLSPICLSYPDVIGADVDAIYIASKQEVYDWAVAKDYSVDYPYGVEGFFAEHTFIVINN